MPIPCEQADTIIKQSATIIKIETTLDHVVSLLEKHEDREDRMLEAMEVVAGQTVAIQTNAENLNRHEKAIDELFKMYRHHTEAEVNFACQVMRSQAGTWVLGIVALGFITDMLAHWQIVKNVLAFIRG